MAKENCPQEEAPLVHLSMTFDAARQSPNRFAEDPNDSRRPDPSQTAPHKPMCPEKVGKLIVQGNNHYASFIRHCKEIADKYASNSVSASLEETFRIFLNKDEIGTKNSHISHQTPYAAVLSCIDARVPPELITGQAANDMFAVRTAGNFLLERGEARGSLEFVLNNYATRPKHEKKGTDGSGKPEEVKPLSVVLVLGHTQCGAIKAAYNAVVAEKNQPVLSQKEGPIKESAHPSLDAIVDRLKTIVRIVMMLNPDIKDPDRLMNRVCHFNTMLNYLDIKRMANAVGLGEGFDVFYGSYHVENCLICSTNLPGKPESKFMKALKREEEGRHPIPDVFESLKRHGSAPATELGTHAKEFIEGSLLDAMKQEADEFADASRNN
ncbi:carbonic anhydrase [Singulisphaera acidiphila]|uniref:Carbonic anhydrase n=1 Tax=Singulisphaera acidiphila (strain ATCC BAA-1392 / DSM 18658 / VKM B-2454 / MOB10) TaxID=886293 RepID=L0D5A8_SINAD|nr:carbonic anhydrase [Singulisphaera acidiphila]AGA24619.1 carbonic anhydrase [Singulisphaera acidiphila DSM 18658]